MRLPVVKRDAQYGGLVGCICLELRQTIRFVAEILSHCHETSLRYYADCEEVAIPWFEFELSGGTSTSGIRP